MSLTPGTRVGPYEIIAPLGAGGMGEVYRARDARLARDVALKVIPAAFATDPDRLARFEQEARAAGTLQHPGICTIFDVGTHDGAPFVVMELLEGETLRARLTRGPLPWRKAVEYAVTIARALATAHEKGFIHRDLKPENLFLTRDGQVKVLDFGLAKLVHPERAARPGDVTTPVALTESGAILGTAGYMAPEQVRGQATDARSDLFAFGAVLYEMLTGERAFKGGSFVETGNAILSHEVELDSAIGRDCPPALRGVVAHCLEKSPDVRFTSARDLAFHLESIRGSEAGGSALVSPAVARRTLPAWAWPLLLVAVLVAGLAGGAVIAPRLAGSPGSSSSRIVHFSLLPPTSGTFEFFMEESVPFAISPDGRSIAFVANDSSGTRAAWLRDVGRLEAKRLPGTENARSLFWSADGRALGFSAPGAIKRYDFSSSGVVTVCATPSTACYTGSWAPDGTILFAANTEGVIYRAPASGGEPKVVLHANVAAGQSLLGWPTFLPDGRRFLYFMRRREKPDSLMIGDLEGVSRPLMAAASRAELAGAATLVYVKDGTLVSQPFDAASARVTGGPVSVAPGISYFATSGGALFAASPGGTIAWQRVADRSRLAWFDESGEETASLGSSGDYFNGMSLTADGRQLLIARRQPETGNPNLWLLDVTRGSESRLSPSSGVTEVFPAWLPGEQGYVFSSTSAGGVPSLHRRDLATEQTSPLLPARGFQVAQDISPDGRTLMFHERRPSEVQHLWLLPLADGEPARLNTTSMAEGEGRFSPDGRLVSSVSYDGGRVGLAIASLGGARERVVVSTRGAIAARWSPDGRRLFFLTPDGHLMASEVQVQTNLHVGEPRVLFSLRGRVWSDFEVAPDGRLLALVPETVQAEEPMDVVVGWRAGGVVPQ